MLTWEILTPRFSLIIARYAVTHSGVVCPSYTIDSGSSLNTRIPDPRWLANFMCKSGFITLKVYVEVTGHLNCPGYLVQMLLAYR